LPGEGYAGEKRIPEIDLGRKGRTGAGRPRIFRAYLDDISLGGFAVNSDKKIAVDKIVEFELMTRLLEQPLVGKGKVRHVRSRGQDKKGSFNLGVEFLDINKDTVKNLVRRNLRQRDKLSFYQQHQRDFWFVLQWTPVALVVLWLSLGAVTNISAYTKEEAKYTEQLKEGLIYSLYSGH
jgi:hypothetical protein